MSHPAKLDAADTQLLIIDLQVKLLPPIEGHESVLETASRIIRAAEIFGLPITVTEQYPKGIGPTHATIIEALDGVEHTRLEKMSFSCGGDPAIVKRLSAMERRQVLVCGIEAHVCVQQTTLDLLRLGWEPFVLADGVSSRVEFDYDIALLRMQQAGAIITTSESFLFDLPVVSATEQFKLVLVFLNDAGV